MTEMTGRDLPEPRMGRIRKAVLVTVLAMLCAVWALAWTDNSRLRESLEQFSRDEVAHYQEAFAGFPHTESVTVVTASRTYLLFGETIGKVDLFIKTVLPGDNIQYSGVEIGFKRQGEQWVVTDSGSCSSEECILKARKAFGDRERAS